MYNQRQDPYTAEGNHRQFTGPQKQSICFNIILLKYIQFTCNLIVQLILFWSSFVKDN